MIIEAILSFLLLILYIFVFYVQMQYGPIVDIDLKLPPRPPGYAFIEVSSNCTNFWYLQSCINVQLWTSILIYFERTFLFWLI